MNLQHKSLAIEAVEFKFDKDRKGFFAGYASMFNGIDSYGDTILPGAYKGTLSERERPVQMRWNHWGPVIGKWLKIEEDEKGLYVEGELTPGHSKAEDVYASMKHGAVTGMSIGYYATDYDEMKNGGRLLKAIDLVEISVVETPADLNAQIGDVKSALEQAQTLKEVESILRDVGGFSHAQAKALVARVKAIGEPRDAEPTKPAINLDELLAIRASIITR
jgi:HK97 family phage prohead protease